MLGFGFVSAAAWVINYVGRGDTLAVQHIQKLRALRADYERHEVEELTLACQRAGFSAGTKEVQDLTAAYRKLHQFLVEQQADQGQTSGERFRVLAEDTYRHGIAILHRALNLFKALQGVDVDTLEQERQAWIRQREQEGPSESLERNIEACTKRLDRYRQRAEELRASSPNSTNWKRRLRRPILRSLTSLGRKPVPGCSRAARRPIWNEPSPPHGV